MCTGRKPRAETATCATPGGPANRDAASSVGAIARVLPPPCVLASRLPGLPGLRTGHSLGPRAESPACADPDPGAEYPRTAMDERVLCERLITYDTSTADGIQSAAGFVKGWLEARDIDVDTAMNNGRPSLPQQLVRARARLWSCTVIWTWSRPRRSSPRRTSTATVCTDAAHTT